MKTIRYFRCLGVVVGLLLTGACATEPAVHPALPVEAAINPEAGRGGFLVVTLRLANGEEVPMIVDCGTTGTFFDSSLAPQLGKPVGTARFQSWGVVSTNNVYATPKLYLGDFPLLAGPECMTLDFQAERDAAGRPIRGLLGWDCLRHYCVQLDFAAGKLRLLDDARAYRTAWGRAFPIVALNDHDPRPAVEQNLLGEQGPHSLIDSGCTFDGWLMPQWFEQWTNQPKLQLPTNLVEFLRQPTNLIVFKYTSDVHSPFGRWGGNVYPFVDVQEKEVESDGLGLRFLARHLVTLDFPRRRLYLKCQSVMPLPDPQLKTTRLPALDPLVQAVLGFDEDGIRVELARVERRQSDEETKNIARKLAATLTPPSLRSPADMPDWIGQVALGDARPESAEVGWLIPTANRIPLNEEIPPPFLDSGRIYATGLFAHAPSRYIFDLGGQWRTLRGTAGLHTAMQGHAYGVVFVIKTDGKEVFRSAAIRGTEHADYTVKVTGIKTLELVVEQAAEQNGGNWALWLDPTLSR